MKERRFKPGGIGTVFRRGETIANEDRRGGVRCAAQAWEKRAV